MSYIYDIIANATLKCLDNLDTLITDKPLVSIIFPTSGFGALFIPNTILADVSATNIVLNFIAHATPYLKFLFLLLTILLTVVSFILQIKKLHNKKE
jgi:hypothetical protein